MCSVSRAWNQQKESSLRLAKSDIPPKELAELERLIVSVNWRNSTTYAPDMQHAYILRKDVPTAFEFLKQAIDQYGFQDEFAGEPHTYLVIGDYKYWAYDTVLNREHVQLTLNRQAKGRLR